MMPKFTIEEHQKRMRDILARRGQMGQRPKLLQGLLDRAKLKVKGKPSEGELNL